MQFGYTKIRAPNTTKGANLRAKDDNKAPKKNKRQIKAAPKPKVAPKTKREGKLSGKTENRR